MDIIMKRSVFFSGLMLIVSLLYTSCKTITEYPGENPVDPTLVNLNVKVSLSPDVADLTSPSDFESNVRQRLVVEVYRLNEGQKPVARQEVLLGKMLHEQDTTITLQVNAAKYRVVVWADYMRQMSPNDFYYYTATPLWGIKYSEEYMANNEEKDCFATRKDIDLTEYSEQWNVNVDLDMPVNRPVGKLIIIADDVEAFISRAQSRGDEVSRAEINKFTARVFYQQFVPNGYSAYGNELNDATTGVSYASRFTVLNDIEAMAAFDYLFASGEGTEYTIGMQVFDAEGNLLNEVSGKTVTVKCNELTILRADFLTGDYNPGITIDHDYDGTIDVILPD